MNKLLSSLSVAVIAGAVCITPSQAEDVEIHGFASQGYIKSSNGNQYPVSDSADGSFNFNDFGINFSKQLSPELRVGMQLFAQSRGNLGKDVVTVDWAYGDYRYQDWLGVRVGKVKIPLGLYNTSRDNDALRNPILLPQGIYTDYYRDLTNALLGVGVYGTKRLGGAGKLSYEFNVGEPPINTESAVALVMGDVQAMGTDTSYNYNLEWQTPVDGLRLAASGLWSKWTGTSPWVPGFPATSWQMDPWVRQVYSAEYVNGNLTLAAEYGMEDYDTDFGDGSPTQKWRGDSWYVSGAYRFTDTFELGGYYNEYYADKHHRDGSSYVDVGFPAAHDMYQKDLALTLRFDPVRNVIVKLEGHAIEGLGLDWLFTSNTNAKNWTLFAAKVTYNF